MTRWVKRRRHLPVLDSELGHLSKFRTVGRTKSLQAVPEIDHNETDAPEEIHSVTYACAHTEFPRWSGMLMTLEGVTVRCSVHRRVWAMISQVQGCNQWTLQSARSVSCSRLPVMRDGCTVHGWCSKCALSTAGKFSSDAPGILTKFRAG
jgi:hypothetical protein